MGKFRSFCIKALANVATCGFVFCPLDVSAFNITPSVVRDGIEVANGSEVGESLIVGGGEYIKVNSGLNLLISRNVYVGDGCVRSSYIKCQGNYYSAQTKDVNKKRYMRNTHLDAGIITQGFCGFGHPCLLSQIESSDDESRVIRFKRHLPFELLLAFLLGAGGFYGLVKWIDSGDEFTGQQRKNSRIEDDQS